MKINKSNLAILTISTALAGCGGSNGFTVTSSLADLSEVAQIEAEEAKKQGQSATETATQKAQEIEENAKKEAEKIKAEALAEAQTEAEKIKQTATAEAEKTKQEANAEAEKTKADAKIEADKTKADAEAEIEELRTETIEKAKAEAEKQMIEDEEAKKREKEIQEAEYAEAHKITDETKVSPLFKNYELIGSLSAYKSANPDAEDRTSINGDSVTYFTFEKIDNDDLKVLFGYNNNTAYESKKIELDDNGFTNIEFEDVGKIWQDSSKYETIDCKDGCDYKYSTDYKLKLGGNKTGLTYTDYGLWIAKTTVKLDDGKEETFYPFITPKTIETGTYQDYKTIYVGNSNINNENVKFTGDTIAYMEMSHTKDNEPKYGLKELSGKIEFDYDLLNKKVNLTIDYDNWETLTGEYKTDAYPSSFSGDGLKDSEGNTYYYSQDYPKIRGNIDGKTVNNAEMVGTYSLYNWPCSGTEKIKVNGAYGAKTDGPLTLKQ